MTKSNSYKHLIPAEYLTLKKKIIAGTVTQEETQTLYDAFQKITSETTRTKACDKVLDEIYKASTSKASTSQNFHKFVKQLTEAEKNTLMKQFPVTENMSPDQIQSNQNKRANEFYRNITLSKRAMIFEAVKENFCKALFKDLKDEKFNKTIDNLASLEVPTNTKDTMLAMKDFYVQNNKESGFYVNFRFHVLGSVTQEYANQKINNNDKIGEIARNKDMLLRTIDIKDSNVTKIIDKQIKGDNLTLEEKSFFIVNAEAKLSEAMQKKGGLDKELAQGMKDKQSAQKAATKSKKPSVFNNPSLALKALTTTVNKIKEQFETKSNKNNDIPAITKPPEPTKTIKFTDKSEVINPETNKQTVESKAPPVQGHLWKKAIPAALKQENQKWRKAPSSNRIEPPLNTPPNPKSSAKGPSL